VNSGIISSSTAILDGTSLVNIAVLPAASGDGLLLPARVLIADRSSVSISAPDFGGVDSCFTHGIHYGSLQLLCVFRVV
jgi:hypothetical protein